MHCVELKVGHLMCMHLFATLCLVASSSIHLVDCNSKPKHIALKTRFGSVLGSIEKIQLQKIVSTRPLPENNSFLKQKVDSSYYYAFRGLPYAEPPVGELRWKDPILKQLHGFYNATSLSSPCPQWISKGNQSKLIGQENCLFADIFVPVRRADKIPKERFKIMVFFHGGGFIKNSNRDMIPTPLLFQENAMIVMFNYRVSVFGYLSTGTDDLAGNYGPLDQIALLKWLQLYAMEFGGDPNNVTIFGSSIGGVSIHYLLLSKLASGLFHRAIIESGSAFCERSLVPNPLEIAMQFGSFVGCQTSNPSSLSTCLRAKSITDLMQAAKSLSTDWVLPSVLGPVIDRNSRPPQIQFLSDYPENMEVVNKIPLIIGVTKDEGLTAFAFLSTSYTFQQLNDLSFIQSAILPKYLQLIMRSRNHVSRKLYIKNLVVQVMRVYEQEFLRDPILALNGVIGDLWIHTCYRKTLESLCSSNVRSVYPYLFTHHDSGESPSEIDEPRKLLHNKGINHPIFNEGVAHTEEILYMLQDQKDTTRKENILTHNKRNMLMSEIISTIWTSFANGIYPEEVIPGSSSLFPSWPTWRPICRQNNFTDATYPLYEISINNHRIIQNYRLKETKFWWDIHQDTFTKTVLSE